MGFAASLRLPLELKVHAGFESTVQHSFVTARDRFHLVCVHVSTHAARQDNWNIHVVKGIHLPKGSTISKSNIFVCRSALPPNIGNKFPVLKSAAVVLTRAYGALCANPVALQLIPALGIIAFATWGIGPLMRFGRVIFLHKSDNSWRKSSTHFVMNSYFQPVLLWIGAILICRALDPVAFPSEASQAVKQRLLNFARSLSTVLAFAFCLSRLIQQAQRFFMEMNDSTDARNMGFDFAGKAMYTAVWVAALSLFMELLGFSTQKWLTAGGLGTVLITLAGREILTNFLSSIMIHATRPFVLNDWIQTKIEGYEVSGTMEHIGWWSPTVIRGDDREAIHIPNHKFTMNVVRNLSQKTHWRVKANFAISHLDVNKINIIVADMRKVLGKNPQVEQQRLHRRVFLENVNPENQALMILVSCFIKTSRFEEYMCVKEGILLDLLRVISHHRARLATPIRTVQKIYSKADLDNAPFAGTRFTRSSAVPNHPLLLIEPTYKTSAAEKAKASPRPVAAKEEKDPKAAAGMTSDIAINMKFVSDTSAPSSSSSGVAQSDSQTKPRGPGSSIQNSSEEQTNEDMAVATKSSSVDASNKFPAANPQVKTDPDRSISSPARSPLVQNIVLGVALEGPKRTLSIEEEEVAEAEGPMERKELAGHQNGSGSSSLLEKEKQDG